jgi:predicted transposase YbfD/YdcC
MSRFTRDQLNIVDFRGNIITMNLMITQSYFYQAFVSCLKKQKKKKKQEAYHDPSACRFKVCVL